MNSGVKNFFHKINTCQSSKVLVKINGDPLPCEDLRRVLHDDELNDQVINVFLDMIPTHENVKILNTFFITFLMKRDFHRALKYFKKYVYDFDRLLIPIHLENHWAVIVVNLRPKRQIWYFDSCYSYTTRKQLEKNEYVDTIRDFLYWSYDSLDTFKEFEIYPSRKSEMKMVPQQNNVVDCGVFALMFILRSSQISNLDQNFKKVLDRFDFTQEDMEKIRMLILTSFYDKKINGLLKYPFLKPKTVIELS